ncbi:MAG: hypothetical protein JOZ58_19825 [Acetobacteraceae bacterium]|nr:hypothetical protein [Acetobacteraceae bacterium]
MEGVPVFLPIIEEAMVSSPLWRFKVAALLTLAALLLPYSQGRPTNPLEYLGVACSVLAIVGWISLLRDTFAYALGAIAILTVRAAFLSVPEST